RTPVLLLTLWLHRYVLTLRQTVRRVRHPRAEPGPGIIRTGHSEFDGLFPFTPAALRASRASPAHHRRATLGGSQNAEALPSRVRSAQRGIHEVRIRKLK